MANFVTVSYGIVTRLTSTSGELPAPTTADDPWIDVSALNPHPVVGDHYDGAAFALDKTAVSTAQGAKIAELRDRCAEHIKLRGFPCWFASEAGTDTLPDPVVPISYVFPSKGVDQSNVHVAAAVAQASKAANPDNTFALWSGIGDASGTTREAGATDWQIREFTITQVELIAAVLGAHIADAQYVLRDRTADALAATTVADVEAVAWTAPNSSATFEAQAARLHHVGHA